MSFGSWNENPGLRRRKIEVDVTEGEASTFSWQGTNQHICIPETELVDIQNRLKATEPRKLLSEWPATAISGNDILGSVFYAAASVVTKAGKLTPIPLIMVSIILYLFRFIYEEVVSAIPMNGGTYNAMLNTTSKRTAAAAACLSILSYLATGVVTATSSVRYLAIQVDIPIVSSVVELLFGFALVALLGITDNSRVALAIFIHHIFVLNVLVGSCLVYATQHPGIFRENMTTKYPEVDFAGSTLDGTAFTAVFFGFGTARLGITGFESSSNYIEEQAPGVFRKALRNMWILSTFFNVSIGVGVLVVLPLEGENGIYANVNALLSKTAEVAMGSWFSAWVSVDAFIVLSGSVLTSYIGFCGLVRRLSTDHVLPSFLANTNKCRGTNHYIIGVYFTLSSSLVLALHAGGETIMNGVYTYSFLGLMVVFACAGISIKGKQLSRGFATSWLVLVLGFVMVVTAIFANLLGDPKVLVYFALYFIGVALVMFVMLERLMILRCILMALKTTLPSKWKNVEGHTGARGGKTLARMINSVQNDAIIFFCKIPDLTMVNKMILYVRHNEQTQSLRIVHVVSNDDTAPVLDEFHSVALLFDNIYPKIRIDFLSVQGDFNLATIEWLSRKINVPWNRMFVKKVPSSMASSSLGVRGIMMSL